MNKIIEQDINTIISQQKYFSFNDNCSILVTGATGLIGSIIVKSLLAYSSKYNKNFIIYAACRNKEKYINTFNENQNIHLIPLISDITKLDISKISLDYIIHGASITDSKTFVEKPVETILTAIEGTNNLLHQCINKTLKGIVYLSSLEIYGSFNNCNRIKNVKENESGYIDTLSVRSSYSEGKRMIENLCVSYANEYKIPIKIARLCQTFGAGVAYNDNRVFAQFARSVIENRNIILKTKGETVRNYCYTTDVVTGIFTVLIYGNIGEAYNIANENTTISIVKLAKLFCSLFPDKKIDVEFDLSHDIKKLGYNPIIKMELNTSKIQKLGWKANISLREMCIRLIEGMKENLC